MPARGRPAQGTSAEDRCQGYKPENGQPRGQVRRTGARDTSQRMGSPGDKCGGQVPGIPARGRPTQGISAEDRCQGYQPEDGQPRGQARRTGAGDTSQRKANPKDKCGGQVPEITGRVKPKGLNSFLTECCCCTRGPLQQPQLFSKYV
jgi:hypothetical protein